MHKSKPGIRLGPRLESFNHRQPRLTIRHRTWLDASAPADHRSRVPTSRAIIRRRQNNGRSGVVRLGQIVEIPPARFVGFETHQRRRGIDPFPRSLPETVQILRLKLVREHVIFEDVNRDCFEFGHKDYFLPCFLMMAARVIGRAKSVSQTGAGTASKSGHESADAEMFRAPISAVNISNVTPAETICLYASAVPCAKGSATGFNSGFESSAASITFGSSSDA